VQAGDTLYTIAAHFGTTADAIVVLNGLPNANLIRVGQVLRMPGESTYTPGAGEYIVQAGDTLYSLASRFGTTVQAIQQANGIVNPTLIRVGQRLTIPQGNSTPPTGSTGTYIVQSGDTLYGIAANLGKNLWDIIAANNLSDPYYIFPGQVLMIP
jgi:LysM repeat protein